MLSNLKYLCPKGSLIAIALAVGMGSMCVTNHAYATSNQAKDYAFSHQSVVDVKTTLHSSNLYSLLLALRAQAPEIETAIYHTMVLSLLYEIASNTRPSVNKLTDIDVPDITEGNGGIQQFIPPKNAGDGGITIVQSKFKNWPDAKQLSRFIQSTYKHLQESKGRHVEKQGATISKASFSRVISKDADDEPYGKLSSFYEAQMSNDRHRLAARIQSNSDQGSCELNRGK